MNISGLIFAAGLGTRLRPITLTTPKPLVKINEKPIIEYQIEWFISLNISEIFINTHYLSEQFEYLPEKYAAQCKIILLNEPEILGHGGTLKKVSSMTENQILTSNADTIIKISNSDVESLLALDNAVLLYKKDSNVLGFDAENNLIRLREVKLSNSEELYSADFAGVAAFTKEYIEFSEYPDGFLGLFGKDDIIEVNSNNGKQIKGYLPSKMSRYEITIPDDISKVEQLINQNE